MKNEMGAFENYLREKEQRLTWQRRAIAEAVFRTHKHFSAEDLWERLRKISPGISRATVYRTVALLADANLLTGLDFGKGLKSYEHICGHEHHEHLICVECDKIIEFYDHELEKSKQEIAQKHGFELVGHVLKMFGYCSACAKKM